VCVCVCVFVGSREKKSSGEKVACNNAQAQVVTCLRRRSNRHAAITRVAFTHIAFTHIAFTHIAFTHIAFTCIAFTCIAFTCIAFTHIAFTHIAFTHIAFTRIAFTHIAVIRSTVTPISVTHSTNIDTQTHNINLELKLIPLFLPPPHNHTLRPTTTPTNSQIQPYFVLGISSLDNYGQPVSTSGSASAQYSYHETFGWSEPLGTILQCRQQDGGIQAQGRRTYRLATHARIP
jgi:hypothetical protein